MTRLRSDGNLSLVLRRRLLRPGAELSGRTQQRNAIVARVASTRRLCRNCTRHGAATTRKTYFENAVDSKFKLSVVKPTLNLTPGLGYI